MPNFKIRSIEGPDSQFDYVIELTEGVFEGLCLHFGKIEMGENDEEGNGQLKFDYDIAFLPEGISLQEKQNELNEVAGDVLRQIIIDIVEREETPGEENRNINSEQPIN